MASNHRLQRRRAGWYYRRRVPLHLRSVFKCEAVAVSLKTSDHKEALALRTIRDLEWDANFAAAEARLARSNVAGDDPADGAPVSLTKEAALQAVLDYVEKTDKRRSELWAADPPANSEERSQALENLQLDLAVAQGRAGGYDHVEYLSQSWAHIFGPNAKVGDVAQNAVVLDLVRRACVEIQSRAIARAEDKRGRLFFDELFDPRRPKPITLRQLAEEFVALKAEEARAFGTSEKNLDRHKGNIVLIREIVGDEVLVREINWDACRRFLSVLAQVPSNRTKKHKGQTLQQAIEEAALDHSALLGHISQQQYLATFKELIELAVKKDLIRTNYASDLRPLKVDEVAPEDKTVPFDLSQLKSFFRSSFYMSCTRSVGEPYRAASSDWRFWFPLLSLFLGMRPKEIYQLHVADLKVTDRGTLFLDITATSDDDGSEPKNKKTLKTATSRRQVPLHPELIAIGFHRFVEDQRRSSDDELLFRGITRDKYDDPAAYPLRRFREVYLKEAIDMRPRQTAYSFRHTWRDAARRIDASADFLKAVGAWQGTLTTSDRYGSKHDPDRFAPVLAKIAYAELDLTYLYLKRDMNTEARE